MGLSHKIRSTDRIELVAACLTLLTPVGDTGLYYYACFPSYSHRLLFHVVSCCCYVIQGSPQVNTISLWHSRAGVATSHSFPTIPSGSAVYPLIDHPSYYQRSTVLLDDQCHPHCHQLPFLGTVITSIHYIRRYSIIIATATSYLDY